MPIHAEYSGDGLLCENVVFAEQNSTDGVRIRPQLVRDGLKVRFTEPLEVVH